MISSAIDNNDAKNNEQLQLLKRIRELKEIVEKDQPILSQQVPVGYTPARWNLALQSFNSRLPHLKKLGLLPNKSTDSEPVNDVQVDELIQFGPEWELKCAQRELEELINN